MCGGAGGYTLQNDLTAQILLLDVETVSQLSKSLKSIKTKITELRNNSNLITQSLILS